MKRAALIRLVAILAMILLWVEPLVWLVQHQRQPLPFPAPAATSDGGFPAPGASSRLPATRRGKDATPFSPMQWLQSLREASFSPGKLSVRLAKPGVSEDEPAPVTPVAGSPASRSASVPLAWARLRGAAGYWRLGMTADGVWWFISPEGKPEFLNTVTTVQPYQFSRDPAGPHYISRDLPGTLDAPGDMKPWARQTMQRVLDSGFKGLGAWCDHAFHETPIAMSRCLNVWSSAPKDAPRLYHPDWLPSAEATIRRQVEPLRDNRYLVGYFTDNELDFSEVTVGPSAYFNGLPPQDPNRQEVMKVMRELWPDLDRFNAAWNLGLGRWEELDGWKELLREPAEAYNRLRQAWIEHVMRDYFRMMRGLLTKYDPNHLYLGIRYAGSPPVEVVRASRDFTDAQSLNYYVADARLDPDLFTMLHEASGQPIVISEYSFHSLDGRSGNRNTAGFAAQVIDQEARAQGYRLLTTRLARVPYVVGADWFQWADEPPAGRGDGEDVNFGVVDIDDRPYEQLVQAVRQTTPKLNALHQRSSDRMRLEQEETEETAMWRRPFVRPSISIMYLATPPRLDGELSDWPAAAQLTGLSRMRVVGLPEGDWSKPSAYLGWRSEGLYLGLVVPNARIQVAPMKGRWWTRDSVEFWVATRPVHSLDHAYNEYCHQFFFLPTDPAMSEGGAAGVVGQWHRPGDALQDHLVPHADIRASCRILGDRYTVEIFIPRKALSGFDPERRPQIAFNLATRNYVEAISWYWSAGKDIHTQSRPMTWGDVRLAAPIMASGR